MRPEEKKQLSHNHLRKKFWFTCLLSGNNAMYLLIIYFKIHLWQIRNFYYYLFFLIPFPYWPKVIILQPKHSQCIRINFNFKYKYNQKAYLILKEIWLPSKIKCNWLCYKKLGSYLMTFKDLASSHITSMSNINFLAFYYVSYEISAVVILKFYLSVLDFVICLSCICWDICMFLLHYDGEIHWWIFEC